MKGLALLLPVISLVILLVACGDGEKPADQGITVQVIVILPPLAAGQTAVVVPPQGKSVDIGVVSVRITVIRETSL